jgi:carbamoyl-phosphate synthase large subunit
MVDYFRSALGGSGKVHVANNDQNLSTMAVCSTQALLPSIYDESYVDRLLDYCLSNDIRLVVPLFDLELSILASQKEAFGENGVVVAVSSSDVCATCLDKVATNQFLKTAGLNTIPFYTEAELALDAVEQGEASFPMFVKPRIGMGSIGLYEVRTPLQLQAGVEMVRQKIEASYLSTESEALGENSIIIQERLPGTHYLLDVINDFDGEYHATIVKKPLSRWAGEANGATTVDLPALQEVGRQLATHLQHSGNADIDVFWDGSNAYILDINPRFGGGYPFSHMAGANFPAAYVAWARGTDVDPDWLTVESNVTSVKGISLHRISPDPKPA